MPPPDPDRRTRGRAGRLESAAAERPLAIGRPSAPDVRHPQEPPLENLEHERFYSRLARLPEVELMPSVGTWILMKVDDPEALAERLNRRLYDGAVSVPHGIPGALRIPVRDARENERVLAAIIESFRHDDDDEDDEDLDG